MGDNRYCYLHFKKNDLNFNNDLSDLLREDLPFEDIQVPLDLLPMTKDEEEATLPSTVHPSYPYGNPFKQLKDAPGPGVDSVVDQLSGTNQRHNPALKWDDLALDELLPKGQAASLEQLKKELHGQSHEAEDEDDDDDEFHEGDLDDEIESSEGAANESF